MNTIIPSELLVHYLKLKNCPDYKTRLLLNSLLNIYMTMCIIWFLFFPVVLLWPFRHYDPSLNRIQRFDFETTTMLVEFILFLVSIISLVIIQFDFIHKYFELITKYSNVLDNLVEVLKKHYPDKNYSEGYIGQYFKKHGFSGLVSWLKDGIIKETKDKIDGLISEKEKEGCDESGINIKLMELIIRLYWIHVFLYTMESVDEKLISSIYYYKREVFDGDFLPDGSYEYMS